MRWSRRQGGVKEQFEATFKDIWLLANQWQHSLPVVEDARVPVDLLLQRRLLFRRRGVGSFGQDIKSLITRLYAFPQLGLTPAEAADADRDRAALDIDRLNDAGDNACSGPVPVGACACAI